MMLLANWTKHGATPNLKGFCGDCSRAGQPSPSPDGPEGLHQLFEIPVAVTVDLGVLSPVSRARFAPSLPPTLVLSLWHWKLGWPHLAPPVPA